MTIANDSGLDTSVHPGAPAPTDPAPAGQRPHLTQAQLDYLLNEIGSVALTIYHLADGDHQVSMPAMAVLASVIGALADYPRGNDGAGAVCGTPIQWLLAPRFFELAEDGGAQ